MDHSGPNLDSGNHPDDAPGTAEELLQLLKPQASGHASVTRSCSVMRT